MYNNKAVLIVVIVFCSLLSITVMVNAKSNSNPTPVTPTVKVISASTLQYVTGTDNSIFGESVTSIGDYNLDGYQDFLVGGRQFNNWQGRAWVYLMGPEGLTSTNASFTITGEPDIQQSGICFGHSVVNLGDVNGDNVTDFAVGGPGSWGGWKVGKMYLFYGNSSTYPSESGTDANQTFESPIQYDWLGENAVSLKDFNGDGISDLAIGAPGSPGVPNSPDLGAVYIYYGNGHGFSTYPNITLIDNITQSGFGLSIASGDLNGDGLSDIAVSSPYFSNGLVSIFYGKNEDNKTLLADVKIYPVNSSYLGEYGVSLSNFGDKVSMVRDINNASISDLLIQYRPKVSPFTYKAVAMYVGSKLNTYTNPDFVLASKVESDDFGSAISDIGDINNDGYNDFAIGASGFGASSNLPGSVFVYYGGPEFVAKPNVIYNGENKMDLFGYSINPVTVNNKTELVIGAPGYNQTASSSEGRVYLTMEKLVGSIISTDTLTITSSSQTTAIQNNFDGNLIRVATIALVVIFAVLVLIRRNSLNKKD